MAGTAARVSGGGGDGDGDVDEASLPQQPAPVAEEEWVRAQEKTFRRWINEQLRRGDAGLAAHDLSKDMGDGVLLARLLSVLQGSGGGGGGRSVAAPERCDNYHRRLESINACLKNMREDNIKLVNIGAEDILSGNLKLILALVWHLILRYQIGKDTDLPRTLILHWLRGVVPECDVNNFTTDWCDGTVLHALLEFCKPGLSADWRTMSRANRMGNCRTAIDIAHRELGIPQLLAAEDLAASALDELSVMTYISYFLRPDSAGYKATLERLNYVNDFATVQNFTTDWADGVALCSLVQSLGGLIPGWPNLPLSQPVQSIQLGLDAARSAFAIEPLVTAEQMARPCDNYLVVMAYAATFLRLDIAAMKLQRRFESSPGSRTHSASLLVRLQCKERGLPVVQSPFEDCSLRRSELSIRGISHDQKKPENSSCSSYKRVDASKAGSGSVDLTIGPLGSNLPHSIRDLGDQRYEVSFIPHDCQDHFIGIQFNGIHVPGSPFVISAPEADLSGIVITGQGHRFAKIGVPAQFNVDCSSTRAALPLQASIAGPSGQRVPARVVDNRNRTFRVEWTPVCGGDHTVDVTYGAMHLPGSPFKVKVTNPQAVVVTSPSAALKGRSVEYQVDIGDAGVGTLECSVLCNGTAVASSVQPSGPGVYVLSFTPTANGPHRVSVQLDGQHVPGSPFVANVTGGAQFVNIVEQSNFHQAGHPVSIKIEATHAGEGQLVAEVRSPSNGIENELRPDGNKTYELSFVPIEAGIHSVIVSFNDQQVPQSPYKLMVQPAAATLNDGQQSLAAPFSNERYGPSAGHSQANASKRAAAPQAHDGGIPPRQSYPAAATPPSHQFAPPPGAAFMPTVQEQQSTATSRTAYKETVGYQTLPPTVNGSGSSTDLARPDAWRGQSADGAPQRQQPPMSARSAQEQSRTITYTPQPHAIVTNEPSYFELNSNGLPISNLDIKVTDPMNSSVPFEVLKLNEKHRVTFVPRRLGTYMVYISVDGVPMPASPYMYFVQHHGGVKLYNVAERAYVGQELDFTVDHTVVDSNDLTVDVSLMGKRIATRQQAIGDRVTRYTFTPQAAGDHCIDVTVNYVAIAGSPFKIAVEDPLQAANSYQHSDTMWRGDSPKVVADVGRGLASFAVSERNHFVLEMRGRHWSLPDMHVDVRAPNGELIAASLIPQANNEIKVEYQSPYVGRHSVDIFYKGRKLPGCPYYVEVFDPKKVSLNHVTSESVVQEQTEFEVVSEEAGRADMECRVISPSGLLIPCRIVNTPRGMTVKYTPVEPGTYYVHTFIGGMEIPGSPMTQAVYENQATLLQRRQAVVNDAHVPAADSMTIQKRRTTHTSSTFDEPDASPNGASASMRQSKYHERHESSSERLRSRSKAADSGLGLLTVYGSGLCCAEVDSEATFFIDTHGMHATPVVLIEGPNSMAKVHIDPHGSSTFKVTYVPVEVGYYSICIKWLNKEIDGSPFRAFVVDPRKVRVHGGWLNLLDAQGRLPLIVNEAKHIRFSMIEAGPGKLRAEVKHAASGRALPVSIDEKLEYEYDVAFVPDEVGDYVINIFWSDLPIPHSPLRGLAISGALPVDHTKVILTGKGLREAYAGQRCEFIIDGSQAGHGSPHVVLKNSELLEMQIPCEALGFNRYRCMYMAPAVGEYLLYVSWSDRELRDSPFPVVVTQSSASEASRVAFNKSLTKTGLINQSFTTMIDTQLAGPGELVARCVGPSKTAMCELIDQGDGQYLLSVKPRETGQHVLEVTYAGQHIAGSPHAFSVSSPPDPSKVQVVGPGVEDGILSTFQSHFFVHTQGAGAGSLSVRVRGPTGGFHVAMRRPTAGERTIECTFSPTEVGLYIVTVRWSDVDVPGSPFYVHIFDTARELERFLRYGTLPGTGDRREYSYLSAMSASEPMLNTVHASEHQQQHGGTGHRHSYRTVSKTRHHTTVHRPLSPLAYQ